MNDRVSNWVARLLAHPAGFGLFNLFTLAWFLAPPLVWWLFGLKAVLALIVVRLLLPSYLDVVTWFSSATQFTLAYQNEKAGRKLDTSLARIDEQTALLVQMAENETHLQEAAIRQSDAVADALAELRRHLSQR